MKHLGGLSPVARLSTTAKSFNNKAVIGVYGQM